MKYLKLFDNREEPKYSINIGDIELFFKSTKYRRGVVSPEWNEIVPDMEWDAIDLITIFLRKTLLGKHILINDYLFNQKEVQQIDVKLQGEEFVYYFLLDDDSWVYPSAHNTIDIFNEIPEESKKIIAKINIQKRFDL